jgi:mitochondrial fission protein ELM1
MTVYQPVVWVVSEGMAGTENQCLGVAEALGIAPIIKRIQLREPWKSLSPYIGCETENTFTGDPIKAPWPDIVLASGRKSIAAVRYIKKQNPATFIVQIQDPRIRSSAFDMIAVPEHDPTRGPNVLVTTASPNRMTDAKLAHAKEEFRTQFESLPAPRVAVLIGGNSKSHTLTVDQTHDICDRLMGLIQNNYGLMITTSRRTGPENERIIKTQLNAATSYIWDGKSPNPYFGMLAWADFIIVTSDSVSMMSEAASTGKPVYVIPLKGGSRRLNRCLDVLLNKSLVRFFDGYLETYNYTPLTDAKVIADEIRRKTSLLSN